MKKETTRFNGLEKGIIVKVVEGNGTKDSVLRIVYYIYTEAGKFLGKIDTIGNEDFTKLK